MFSGLFTNNVFPMNRECNGAKNIHKITYNAINGKERPSYLCRNTSKSTFTRPETGKPSQPSWRCKDKVKHLFVPF